MLMMGVRAMAGRMRSGDLWPDDGSSHLIKERFGPLRKVADDELEGTQPATLCKKAHSDDRHRINYRRLGST